MPNPPPIRFRGKTDNFTDVRSIRTLTETFQDPFWEKFVCRASGHALPLPTMKYFIPIFSLQHPIFTHYSWTNIGLLAIIIMKFSFQSTKSLRTLIYFVGNLQKQFFQLNTILLPKSLYVSVSWWVSPVASNPDR